uniref:Uncharacterized protein n=1 Tax=Tanacetum cinerariifolium TaxID=118510 RepID=A0A699IJT1_TANCI|nr:hypothetical protein [Tanacetum cinerariifolium]
MIKSQIPEMVDAQLSTRLEDSIHKAFKPYTAEFEKKAKYKRKRYIDLVENSVKDIIKDEVKSQLPHILPKEVYEFATLVIQSTITESLENVVLAKSSSQPKSTYEVVALLIEFELKKILLDKIQDKDKDPPIGSDQDLNKRNMSKDVDPSKGSKSKESKSGSSKGTKSQSKSFGKSAQAKESVFEIADTEMPQNQEGDFGNTDDQPNTWISKIAKAEKPPLTFDELMSYPIDFSVYVINNLKIDNLTQDYLVGSTFNLIKRMCRSRVELEYHFEECYKAVTDRLDRNNPKGQEYPFDLSGSPSRKYTTSTTKTKANKYDDIQGIEDMVPSLWSLVKKLSNQERDVIFDLNVALRMFTRRVVILKQVKNLQLGVESYQKKLNITRLETFRTDISKRTPNTAYNNPQGIIYVDKFKRNTMDYLPKRRWSNLDKQVSRIMIKAIDKLQFERRLMRNLKKFVVGREYKEDFRLLERTI